MMDEDAMVDQVELMEEPPISGLGKEDVFPKEDDVLKDDEQDVKKSKPVVFLTEQDNQSDSNINNDNKTKSGGGVLDDYYKSSDYLDDDEKDHKQEDHQQEEDQSGFDNVLPMDKIRNGAANALKFWNWGVEKVSEQAEELKKNDNVKQASEKFGEIYEQMKPGIEKVKVGAGIAGEKIKEGANTVYEKSKPKVEELSETIGDFRERSQPKIDELSKQASETWQITKEKVVEASEACKPGIERAVHSTRSALFKSDENKNKNSSEPPSSGFDDI